MGSCSGCGESITVFGFLVESWLYHAELVTILNVEPGGSVVCDALFSSGLGSSAVSLLSIVLSLVVSCTASWFGS